MVICPYCDQHLPATEFDEYTPDRLKDSFAIPYENLPKNKDEVHVWRGDNGTIFMHFD